MTVKEAAELMRIGRDMAYALVAENKIPNIRLGEAWQEYGLVFCREDGTRVHPDRSRRCSTST